MTTCESENTTLETFWDGKLKLGTFEKGAVSKPPLCEIRVLHPSVRARAAGRGVLGLMKVLFVRHAQSLNNAVQGQVQTKLASGCTDVHGAQVCRLLSFCRERGPLSQDPSLSRPPFPERMAVHAARGPATVRCREVRPASSATHVACAPASGVKARQLNPLLFSQGTAPFAFKARAEVRQARAVSARPVQGLFSRCSCPALAVHSHLHARPRPFVPSTRL